MKLTFWKKTLYRQFVFAFSLIILLPVTVIGTLSYNRSVRQLETQTKKMLEQILVDTNSQLDKEIRDYTWIMNRIITSGAIYDFFEKRPDDPLAKLEFTNWMNSMVFKDFFLDRSYVDGIAIIADNGAKYIDFRLDSINNERYYSEKVLKDMAEILPQDGKTKIFTTGLKDEDSYKNGSRSSFLVTIGKRIVSLRTLRPFGAFYLNLRSTALSEIWEKVDLQKGYLWITDAEGVIIHHPDVQMLGRNIADVLDLKIIEGGKGKFRDSADQEEYFFVSRTSGYTGWRVITAIPISQMSLPADNMKYAIMLISLIAFVCTMGLAFLFFRSIIKPVKSLQQSMKAVGKGKWERMEGRFPPNEMGELIEGFNSMVDKISDLIDRIYKSELEKHEVELTRQRSEMQALQMQINPHFLYNTLANINAYSEVNNREAIQDIVKALGSMFRYAVLNPMEPVRVKDEIEHVNNYMKIQKYRCNCVPDVVMNINGFENHRMLRLILQPLFENVFKHAFPDGIEPFHRIIVDVSEEEGNLAVTVTDNGAGTAMEIDNMELLPDDRSGKGGIGLANVNRRLKLAYGEEYGIRISGKKGEGTSVKMLMPLEQLDSDENNE